MKRISSLSRLLAATACAAVLLLAGVVGCGRRAAAPPTVDNTGYHELRELFGDRDFGPLAERRIVVDPGHGGVFRGVTGRDGLDEADVNLGVALWLRGLLEWADAEVHLTRTADRDFLDPADSSLAADLAVRIAMVDSLRPDVFLSIHHNSNPELDRTINETQTYYPVGSDGPDLDLARAIHRHLVRNLEISPARIMPGNFFVLRNSPVPAVLGEPSMLSNPDVERKLSLAAKQQLEARAYFLGLLDYFSGGDPRFEGPFRPGRRGAMNPIPLREDRAPAPGRLIWKFRPDGADRRDGPALDPSSVRLVVDGSETPASVSPDGTTISTRVPKRWSRGEHEIVLRARNLSGRAVRPWIRRWTEDFGGPVEKSVLVENPAYEDRARALIRTGPADPEGARIEAAKPAPETPRRCRRMLVDRDDRERDVPLSSWPGARTWDIVAVREVPDDPIIRIECPGLIRNQIDPMSVSILPDSLRFRMTATWPGGPVVPGGTRVDRLAGQRGGRSPAIGAMDDPHGPVMLVREGEPLWFEAPGAFPLLLDETGTAPWADEAAAWTDTLRWRPLLPGAYGKTVVIDPRGGAAIDDGRGPLGSTGSEINLRVAEYLADLLTGAGARPILIRKNESWMPPEERVLKANRERADLYVEIRRSAPDGPAVRLRHHHGSNGGGNWARMTADAMRACGVDSAGILVEPSWAYLLRHTACPALEVSLAAPASLAAEDSLTAPACQQATARALFAATVSQLAGRAVLFDMIDLSRLLADHPEILPAGSRVDRVRWDGNLLWLPGEPGPGLPAVGTEHTLEIGAAERWTLTAVRLSPDGTAQCAPVFSGAAEQP